MPRRRRSRNRFGNVPNVLFRQDANRVSAHGLFNPGTSYQSASIGNEVEHVPNDSQMLTSNDQAEHLSDDPRRGRSDHFSLSVLSMSGNGIMPPSLPEAFEDRSDHWNDVIPDPPAPDNITTVESRNPITNWRVLWALLQTCGNQRFTREQYQSLRLFSGTLVHNGLEDWKITSAIDGYTSSVSPSSSYLPHYSTLYKSVKPILFRSLTVRSFTQQVTVDLRKAGARSRAMSLSGDPTISLKIVLPSEYARADLATPLFFEAIQRTSLEYFESNGLRSRVPRISCIDCVDLLPLVAARDWFYGPPKSISVDGCADTVPRTCIAEAGDVLSITLLAQADSEVLEESFKRCFCADPIESVHPTVSGRVMDVWMVRHGKRAISVQTALNGIDENAQGNISVHDALIKGVFDFVSYSSPSDSVTVEVPDLPLGDQDGENQEEDDVGARRRAAELKRLKRQRKLAMDERRRQVDLAWRNWEKPILKPGDTVALLSPCSDTIDGRTCGQRTGALLTTTDLRSRLLLINRYWTEQEERSTHILWIPGGSDLQSDLRDREKSVDDLRPCSRPPIIGSLRIHAYVKEVLLVDQHGGRRGPQKFNPVSSFGTLSTGELYCVYHFVLFWDGFEVQDGKEASGDGIYLLCMNLPTSSNRTPNDVRIVSLTPPGVKSDIVLREICADIVKGMVEGFLDVDGNGQTRRIFLDLLGFIGDTPAINAFLDVLGHNACACCHLCRYIRRSSTIVGSRFSGRPPNATRSAMTRGVYQQEAVRDCAPGKEACRLLGLKYDPYSSNFALHYIRSEMLKVRSRIPKTSEGWPVVPCALDPYKACMIAPDHLLTGHLRDCLNLAVKLLPSTAAREISEGFMIGMLRDCKISAQARLINHEKKKLHGMTMSELYALGLVAHRGLEKGMEAASERDERNAALSLVRSVSRLITEFWFKPDRRRDSTQDVNKFENNYGNDYLIHMRTLVDEHIELIEHICAMRDSDSIALEESCVSTHCAFWRGAV